MQSNKTVDEFIARHDKWKVPLVKLREILLATELIEMVKWGNPVYALQDKHVVGMGAFKSYVGLWFFNGSLLSDPNKILVNAQEGKTKAMRQMRFSSVDEINYGLVTVYVHEAIQNQKAGKQIKRDLGKTLIIPDELAKLLESDHALKVSFDQLSLSKRREYASYIQTAKQENTKNRRLEKIIPMIVAQIGLNDKYR